MKWSISKACREWSIDQKTLKKRLLAAGHKTDRGKTFTTLQICNAIYTERELERTREVKARADLLEMELQEKAGTMVSMEEVSRLYSESLVPVRQALLGMPSDCAARANPTDPTFARVALQAWVDRVLPQIREKLPK